MGQVWIVKMEPISWDNTTGARIIIDNWSDGEYSYAIILHPNNQLKLTFTRINK